MISRFMDKKSIFCWTYFLTKATLICVWRMFRIIMVLYPLSGVGSVLTHGAGIQCLTRFIRVRLNSNWIIKYCSKANHPSFVSRMLIKNMCSNDVSYFRNVKCSDAKQNSNQFYLSLDGSLLLPLCLYKRLHPAIKPLAFTPISSNINRKINDNNLLPSKNLFNFHYRDNR